MLSFCDSVLTVVAEENWSKYFSIFFYKNGIKSIIWMLLSFLRWFKYIQHKIIFHKYLFNLWYMEMKSNFIWSVTRDKQVALVILFDFGLITISGTKKLHIVWE